MAEKKIADRVLVQKSTATGEERGFEIYNRKYLRVSCRGLRSKRRYDLHLAMLEPWPIRHRRISWRWLGIVLILAAASGGAGWYIYASGRQVDLSLWVPVLAGLVFFTLGALVMFVVHSPNVTEFRSRYGGCVLVSLFYGKPARRQFQEFVEELKNRILAASQELAVDKSQMLAIELKELRRLAGEGAITDADYARAKERIFRLHGSGGG